MKPVQKFRNSKHQLRGLKTFIQCLPSNSIGVEVGSAYGESMAIFMKSGRVRELLCVDSWEGAMADREASFDMRADKWPGRVHKAKARSCYVGNHYAQSGARKFDFVYIDAKHDYAHISEDIQIWRLAIKTGGILAGHDYRNDVQRAVDAAFGKPERVFDDSTWMVKL